MNPVAENPLHTREDFLRAVDQIVNPMLVHASPGKARIRPTATGAAFSDTAIELEGFARLLWGVVPRSVSDDYDRWDELRSGLVNGTDPSHDEYWGAAGDYSQKHVEMAPIGLGLALAPERVWEPLTDGERERLVTWLNQINDAALHDSNWQFFRVLVNLGLREVGARHDPDATQRSLDQIESFHQGDGWYTDGPAGGESPVDYYLPWAMHYYGLLYSEIAGERDPERAARFRRRAASFATNYVHWFDDDGAAIPFGRSLTYRFAQAGFWGALAFADLNPLSWARIRGLWARNVRWWLDEPIFTDGGLLSVGYRYPTLKTAEVYNSPNSPYWALKAFLPLALDADHPFWQADEAPLPDLPEHVVQPEAGKVVCRGTDHLFALSGCRASAGRGAKYAKFAYSAQFGFSVGSRKSGSGQAGHDSTLALSLDGDRYEIPASFTTTDVDGTTLRSRWDPWDGVRVDTWLTPALPWHVRVHRLDTSRRIHSEEGGFPLGRTADDGSRFTHDTSGRRALAGSPNGVSMITDLDGGRTPAVVSQEPNTNVLHPSTVVPTLRGRYEPGEHWLASAVAASPDESATPDSTPQLVALSDGAVAIERADGERILHCDPSDQ